MTSFGKAIDYIRENISDAALYEQLAEECVELAHVCQKKARILRYENPTGDIDIKKLNESIVEEYSDVLVSAMLLELNSNHDIYFDKILRWNDRIHERNARF